ncbi:MAG TPA: hypothetical protein VE441_10445, partial [Mycobacterium sp.]|nr:hypothetical protein [Mycobacterium sp.]
VAAGSITPAGAVYVEAPFATAPLPVSRDELRRHYAHQKASRTEAWYRQHRPSMLAGDIEVETAASRHWDIDTAVSLSLHAAGRSTDLSQDIPSLIIRADPSDAITEATARQLTRRGFTVRSMRGAGHTVWHGRVPEFLSLITEWLADQGHTR